MTILVPIALIGWIFIAIAMFAVMTPRRAVLAAFLLGWLFLPQAGIDIPGLPDLNKITATSLGAVIGVLLFDTQRVLRYRFSWVDLPMIVWCLASIPSALLNTTPLGATSPLYDGISGVVKDALTWGVPYFIGRIYFNDFQSIRELAIAIFVGGLIYAPLCLFELRMSPCLHKLVYGFHPSEFLMTIRYGGYRPMVFMQHGLMLGMWMTCTSLIGVWLWASGSLPKLWGMRTGPIVLGLVIVTIMCKSTGAIMLLALGLAVLFANKHIRSTALLLAIVVVAPIYMFVRAEGFWSGKQLIDLAAIVSEDRAESIEGRLENEDLLTAKAIQKPWFGWGGWGQWRVYDEDTGKDVTVSDGMWIIARGEKGLVGLASVTAVVLLPFILLLIRAPAGFWSHAWYGAPAALAMMLMLYSIDNLFNAMLNPIYLLAAGALSGLYLAYPRVIAQAQQAHARWVDYRQIRHASHSRPLALD
jgi:O-antigen ligase